MDWLGLLIIEPRLGKFLKNFKSKVYMILGKFLKLPKYKPIYLNLAYTSPERSSEVYPLKIERISLEDNHFSEFNT